MESASTLEEDSQLEFENLARLRKHCENDQEFEQAVEKTLSFSLENQERYNNFIKPLLYVGIGYTAAGVIQEYLRINCHMELVATMCIGMFMGHFKTF